MRNCWQIANDNIANQIHGFTIDYGKFILIIHNSSEEYFCIEALWLSPPDNYIPLAGKPEFICNNILTWLCFSILILLSTHKRNTKRNKCSRSSGKRDQSVSNLLSPKNTLYIATAVWHSCLLGCANDRNFLMGSNRFCTQNWLFMWSKHFKTWATKSLCCLTIN